mmetsp:Transcript_10600/g.19967  ORF Transcript_10600/g.19967 Transcript_10600/m.19967 type:complete len:261 (+) Transcript_10600:1246-2028(+)
MFNPGTTYSRCAPNIPNAHTPPDAINVPARPLFKPALEGRSSDMFAGLLWTVDSRQQLNVQALHLNETCTLRVDVAPVNFVTTSTSVLITTCIADCTWSSSASAGMVLIGHLKPPLPSLGLPVDHSLVAACIRSEADHTDIHGHLVPHAVAEITGDLDLHHIPDNRYGAVEDVHCGGANDALVVQPVEDTGGEIHIAAHRHNVVTEVELDVLLVLRKNSFSTNVREHGRQINRRPTAIDTDITDSALPCIASTLTSNHEV